MDEFWMNFFESLEWAERYYRFLSKTYWAAESVVIHHRCITCEICYEDCEYLRFKKWMKKI